jgi:hypothetical protein
LKLRWHHPDDSEVQAAQSDGFAEDVWITAKQGLPPGIAAPPWTVLVEPKAWLVRILRRDF